MTIHVAKRVQTLQYLEVHSLAGGLRIMEIRVLKEVSTVVGHVCDACGQECYKHADPKERPHSDEHATFSAHWGYHSNNKDLDRWNCDLCESCAEKVKDFIEKTLGGKVRVEERY